MKKVNLFLIICLFYSLTLHAQEEQKEFEPSFYWSGFTHIWAGAVQRDSLDTQYGIAVRYFRFKAFGNLTPKVKWAAQIAFDKGSPSLRDIHISYEPVSFFKIRFGQFPVPGAKSAVFSSPLWSSTKMMFNDRAPIVQEWASHAGLSGYRSAGAMFYGNIIDKKLSYYVMGAIPKAGASNYFNVNVKTPMYNHPESGLAMFSRLEFKPMEKIETGVNFHTGKGTQLDTTITKRLSYSVYVISREGNLFVMAEYIGGKVNTDFNTAADKELKYNGYKIELAYNIAKKIEPAIRYDSYLPNDDKADKYGYKRYNNVTLGLNYYAHKKVILMANYVLRMESPVAGAESIDNNLFYIQLRYLFTNKK